ncbi:pectin acetylesterase-family hydrolase [Oligoflexus tunisiensis]|uniref:pectin acetylesterase-family hydrolase n=1 Tax=Oligoflexus tunisiensis TaxID=708132 RepID=UPI000A6DF869|nr:pectin acetylesterase-family hydrolase [Oligoflexus tunisiensis]
MLFRSRIVLFLMCALGLQSSAWSQTDALEPVTIVDILSEPENNLHHELILYLNEQGDIEKISRVSPESEQSFTLDDLLTQEIVLAQSSGIDAVLISCADCDPDVGGSLNLRYIYNGITKTYQNFSMRIQRSGRIWTLLTQDGTPIYSLTLKARKVFGATVGIKEIGVNEFKPSNMFVAKRSTLKPHSWNELQPGGNTVCARGDAYKFYVNPGSSDNLIIDFVGGGACWDYDTCNKATATFNDSPDLRDWEKQGLEGIYNRNLAQNPFREWNHVLVPYCTGDIHWGDSEMTYSKDGKSFTIQHRGAVNAQAVLRWAQQEFPHAKNILVTGTSAGSYGSVYWTPQIKESFPEARVAQVGDSGVGVISQDFKVKNFPNWNPFGHAPKWIPELNVSAEEWIKMDLFDVYAAVGRHYPNINLGQYSSIADDNQVFFYEVMGGKGGVADWQKAMLASLHTIRDTTPNFNYYVGTGSEHCILYQKFFYSMNVAGTAFVDWLWQAANSEQISQVE